MDQKRVSCLCLTVNGQADFLQQAVECFNRQTYADRELVIVPDAIDHPVGRSGMGVPSSLLVLRPPITRLPLDELYPSGKNRNLLTGTKRNRGCEYATGEYIAVWDDDDYYAPRRLEVQVAALEASGKAVTAFRRVPFQQDGEWFMSPEGATPTTSGLGIGASLLFRRDWWDKHRFHATPLGEDALFCLAADEAGQLLLTEERDLMYVRRHAGNTWKLNLPEVGWERMPGYAWRENA